MKIKNDTKTILNRAESIAVLNAMVRTITYYKAEASKFLSKGDRNLAVIHLNKADMFMSTAYTVNNFTRTHDSRLNYLHKEIKELRKS